MAYTNRQRNNKAEKSRKGEQMVTLRFVFNQDKLKQAGKTEDEMLATMREHAKKYEIAEPEPGYFVKDGENALCALSMFVPKITSKNPSYIQYMDEWTLNVDGEPEDCIAVAKRWEK
jgi:hypothetical protein